jgi:hypothetical protein
MAEGTGFSLCRGAPSFATRRVGLTISPCLPTPSKNLVILRRVELRLAFTVEGAGFSPCGRTARSNPERAQQKALVILRRSRRTSRFVRLTSTVQKPLSSEEGVLRPRRSDGVSTRACPERSQRERSFCQGAPSIAAPRMGLRVSASWWRARPLARAICVPATRALAPTECIRSKPPRHWSFSRRPTAAD